VTPMVCDLVVLGGGIVGLWTARLAARAGARVVVVEVGPRNIPEQRDPTPPIRFAARENLGALRARNHVLTGNSSYWGGGLVRNPRGALDELFGVATAAQVEREYPVVETTLGVGAGFTPAKLVVAGRALHEVAVLPGRRRGVWGAFEEPGVNCLTNAHVTKVVLAPGKGIERAVVQWEGHEQVELVADQFALSMGVIDSNLFAQRWLASSVPAAVRGVLGTRLHDHWSVPVADLLWQANQNVDQLFPPKFRAGIVAGRRVVVDRGFFHVTVDLDKTPPYDRVKELMRVRQQGKGNLATITAAASTMASPLRMLRAGIHYLTHRELFIADGSRVQLVLDFESSRSTENKITNGAVDAVLHWDVRDDDHGAFGEIVRANRDWWEAVWRSAGIDFDWQFSDWSSEALRRHLDEHAIDAYHLGGGLHPDTPADDGVSESNGRLRGCPNTFVNGTAFFSRPGPANPVLTLLARASVYVGELAGGGIGS